MARVQERALAASGASTPIVLNHFPAPFNAGFGVVKGGTGDITYSVQHTFDDVGGGATATWFDHSLVSGKTASVDGSYLYPVMAVRLAVTAVSGAVTATLKLVQAGV